MLQELQNISRVLCVQPHYDDNDLGAGGSIAVLHDSGIEVHYLTVADDQLGVLDPDLTEDEALERLREEQERAGALIGVDHQIWLGFPDAGEWDYFALRRELIRHIRRIRPELLITVDPWLPHEAHSDHLRTGKAVAEASFLQASTRLQVDPEIDRQYEPYEIQAVAFYFTKEPNTCVDITATRGRKHAAIDCYRAQLSEDQLKLIHFGLDLKEQEWAAAEAFSHGEGLKVLPPSAFHVGL